MSLEDNLESREISREKTIMKAAGQLLSAARRSRREIASLSKLDTDELRRAAGRPCLENPPSRDYQPVVPDAARIRIITSRKRLSAGLPKPSDPDALLEEFTPMIRAEGPVLWLQPPSRIVQARCGAGALNWRGHQLSGWSVLEKGFFVSGASVTGRSRKSPRARINRNSMVGGLCSSGLKRPSQGGGKMASSPDQALCNPTPARAQRRGLNRTSIHSTRRR